MKTILLLALPFLLMACSEVPGEKPKAIPIEFSKKFAGLSAHMSRDSNGHVHLKSDTEIGVTIAMGYTHATDRAWQMDYFRRIVQGRAAEVHGYFKLRVDIMMRLMGLYEQAEKITNALDKDTNEWLWAYSYGVNKAFAETQFDKIYEFKKLNYKPLPWTPTDTVALILLQSFDQTRETFLKEIRESEWISKYGDESKELFIEDNLPWDTSILKKGEYAELQSATVQNKTGPTNLQKNKKGNNISSKDVYSFFDTGEQAGVGSNNWVVAPQLSTSGNALLANDPHLQLRHPTFWHWSHLQSPKINAMGASFPGIPFITSGLNENVSWGITNAYLDTGKISYISEDLLVSAKSFRPTIWINFYGLKIPFAFKTLRRLEGHPILPLDAPPGKAMILDWTGYLVAAEHIAAMHTVQSSKSVQDAMSFMQKLDVPSWNFVFADTKGNIGYAATGRVYKHIHSTTFGISDHMHGQSLNHDLLEKSAVPKLYNPKRGYVVTANNRQWPKEARWHGGNGYRASFRAFQIEALLKKTAKHNVDSFKSTACDVEMVDAVFLKPLLIGHLKELNFSALETQALEEMSVGAKYATLDCRGCATFRRTMDRIMEALDANEQYVFRWLKNGDAKEVSNILSKEFPRAVHDITKNSDGKLTDWGTLHRNYFRHVSDDKKFFSSQYINTIGDDQTVNPGSSDWQGDHFNHSAGASQRLIVEMSTPPKAIVQLAGTNIDDETPDFTSENSAFKAWAECHFKEVLFPFDWSKVSANSLHF